MEKIKVGYLPLYIKLYDDSDPHYRDPMVNYMNAIVGILRTRGLDVVMADEVCRTRSEFERAAKKFNDEDVVAVITQHLAYSPSLESIDALLSLKAPIVVFDTTPDYELVEAAGYESRIPANHGIHGVQEMTNMLKKNGRPYYLCVGHALHSDVLDEVTGMCRAAGAAKFFRQETVGSVGGEFDGMGDFRLTDEEYKNGIGAEVRYMTKRTAAKYLKKVTEKEIDEEIAYDRSHFECEVTWDKEYRAATKSGLAIRKWMEEEKIDAVTVNFTKLDQYGIPKMPFVECSKILGRGKGYAGEGDTLTAGLEGALSHVYPETTFVEMFCPDWKRDVILMSHMGESNPRLAEWKPLITDCPFNYNSCGNTVAMYTSFKPGKVVLTNLSLMKDHFQLVVTPAEMVSEAVEVGAYHNANQGWFRPCMNIRDFLRAYSYAGGTHHSAMVYNVSTEEIEAFGRMMGFEVITIR